MFVDSQKNTDIESGQIDPKATGGLKELEVT